jgi:hypothetical protein
LFNIKKAKNMVLKMISGGQTGADLGGLKAAKELGIPTGGEAPKGFKTELGCNLELQSIYGLKESPSEDYGIRTVVNIRSSDATLIFSSNAKSPGTKLTIKHCEKLYKPYIIIDPKLESATELTKAFLEKQYVRFRKGIILNVAGNRESKSPGTEAKVEQILLKILEQQ